MQGGTAQALIVLIVLAAVGWYLYVYARRSRSLLEKWASEHQYQLVHREHRWFRKGPFFWSSSKGQAVYRVEILDEQAGRRKGWVRCGGWWLGVFADQVEVKWDD
jgi:hypothetical protein